MNLTRAFLVPLLALACAVLIAGCGDDGASSAATATTPPAHGDDHGAAAADDHADADHDGHGGHDPEQMHGDMETLATKLHDGMRIEVVSMGPETFTVEEGDRTIVHRPSPDDNVHLMVTLADERTGERIPYSSVQIALSKDGRRVVDTRLWPMISQHVGMHYGENLSLPESGRYEAVLTVGAPAVARHEELADKWTRPVKITFDLDWTAPR